MFSHPRIVVGCAGAVIATTCFFLALDGEVTARGVDPGATMNTVNRAIKGDRLLVRNPSKIVPARQPRPMLDGCETS
jgi:hypothetical protein